jgi:hypothetical protein
MNAPPNPAAAQTAPAAERNRAPILAVLKDILPETGLVLEIASGTGQHAAAFATAFPKLTWQPSDPAPHARASIDAWRQVEQAENLLPPMDLDTSRSDWNHAIEGSPVAILCINMIHIAPWAACAGLIRGSGCLLPAGGPLYLYGPFRRGGAHTAPSNAAFDRALRAENPEWGVRDLEAVAELAEAAGLHQERSVAMPANNLSVVFQRRKWA